MMFFTAKTRRGKEKEDVIPAQAGTHSSVLTISETDSCFRRNDTLWFSSRLRVFAVIVFLAFSFPAFAGLNPAERMDDPALEMRAQAIYERLRCVVCQGQSVAGSDAGIAEDLRALVRDRLKAGESDAVIFDYVHSRYGDFILMKPPLKTTTLLLWFLPGIIFLSGVFLVTGTMRKKT